MNGQGRFGNFGNAFAAAPLFIFRGGAAGKICRGRRMHLPEWRPGCQECGGGFMNGILIFIGGILVGAFLGVLTMALVQINRD